MAVPKKKHTRSRSGKRRGAKSLSLHSVLSKYGKSSKKKMQKASK
ncbi:hypothetical protein ACFL2C_03380 [Patescibacteria group bacterium]